MCSLSEVAYYRNTDILEGRGMGDVLHPELRSDNTARDAETPGKTRNKCPGYYHVLAPREMLPGTNCLGKTAPDVTTGIPCHAPGERLQMHTAFHASAILLVCSETRPNKGANELKKELKLSLFPFFFPFFA